MRITLENDLVIDTAHANWVGVLTESDDEMQQVVYQQGKLWFIHEFPNGNADKGDIKPITEEWFYDWVREHPNHDLHRAVRTGYGKRK